MGAKRAVMSEQQGRELLAKMDRLIAVAEVTRDATLALIGMKLSGEPPEGFQAAYLRARAAGEELADGVELADIGAAMTILLTTRDCEAIRAEWDNPSELTPEAIEAVRRYRLAHERDPAGRESPTSLADFCDQHDRVSPPSAGDP